MNNNTIISLINKLIDKTKNNSIHWKKYSSSKIELKSLPPTPFNNLILPIADSYVYQIDKNNSFICSYEDGIFALLLYTSSLLGSYVQLRIQTQNSPNSIIFASSDTKDENKINEAAQLKRLYNLVNTSQTSFEIDTFIDDFLKSE